MCKKFLLSQFAFTISLLILSLQSVGQINNGRVLNYSFNNNFNDQSINNFTATPINNPAFTLDRNGLLQGAISFNGIDQYLNLPFSTIIQPTSYPYSLAFWIYPLSPISQKHGIFSSDQSQLSYNGTWINLSNNMEISVGTGLGAGPNNRKSTNTSVNIPYNTWSHIVIIMNSFGNTSVYLNCLPVSVNYSGFATFGPVLGTSGGNLGRVFTGSSSGGYFYFHGALDDFMMWNRALTLSEVQSFCSSCYTDTLFLSSRVCQGDSVFFNGIWRASSGVYSNTFRNFDGCDSTEILNLTVDDTTTFDQNFSICQGDSITFDNVNFVSLPGFYTYNFTSTNGCDSTVRNIVVLSGDSISIIDTICNSEFIYINDEYYYPPIDTAFYFIDSINGCNNFIEINLTATVDTSFNSFQIEVDSCVNGTYFLSTFPALNVNWSNGSYTESITTSNLDTVFAFITTECDSTIVGLSLNENVCDSSPIFEPKLYVPNVFSPNADGINDAFIISGVDVSSFNLIIFNRWGSEIFHSDNLFYSWDGRYKGQNVPQGTYFYIIHYSINGNPTEMTLRGTLTLFR